MRLVNHHQHRNLWKKVLRKNTIFVTTVNNEMSLQGQEESICSLQRHMQSMTTNGHLGQEKKVISSCCAVVIRACKIPLPQWYLHRFWKKSQYIYSDDILLLNLVYMCMYVVRTTYLYTDCRVQHSNKKILLNLCWVKTTLYNIKKKE